MNSKSSIKPPGASLILDLQEGGLFTKSSDKVIFGSFSVILPHILQNQHMILWLKYKNATQFLSQTILKLTCKVL